MCVLLAAWLYMTSGWMDRTHKWITPTEQPGTVSITQSVKHTPPPEAQATAKTATSSVTNAAIPAGTQSANSGSPDTAPISSPNSSTPKTPALPTEMEPQGETALLKAVQAWRKAWQTQDLPTYLNLYGPNFVPPQGASRQAWADTRRARIGSKQKIELSLKNLTLQMQGNTATVKFTQVYADERVRMVNGKTMVWQQADGRWLIQSETTD